MDHRLEAGAKLVLRASNALARATTFVWAHQVVAGLGGLRSSRDVLDRNLKLSKHVHVRRRVDEILR